MQKNDCFIQLIFSYSDEYPLQLWRHCSSLLEAPTNTSLDANLLSKTITMSTTVKICSKCMSYSILLNGRSAEPISIASGFQYFTDCKYGL